MTAKSTATLPLPPSLEGEILDGRYALTEAQSQVGDRQLYAAYDMQTLGQTMLYVWRGPDGKLSFQQAPTLRALAPILRVVPSIVAPPPPSPEAVVQAPTPTPTPAAKPAPQPVQAIPQPAALIPQPPAPAPQPAPQAPPVRRRLRTALIEAAWFAHGIDLEDEEEKLEELVNYSELQASLETKARDLSPDDYKRFALDTLDHSQRKRDDDARPRTLSLPRLVLDGAL